MVDGVLWHINPWMLFNVKSCLYICIKCIWFVNEYFVGNDIFKRAWAQLSVHIEIVSGIDILHK